MKTFLRNCAPPLALAILAQAAAPARADDRTMAASLDGVVATGSAIKARDLVSEHPITVITAEDLRRSGALTLQQFLQTVPSVGFQGLNSNQVNGLLNGSGNNYVDLRSLGPARTLVLVDGKRFPPSSNQTSEAVDIGNIPVPLIERIEILRDGASPIYGSDAIGGVINVILRQHVDGLEIGAQAGTSTLGDGTSVESDLTWGRRLAHGDLVLNLDFNQTDPILQRDRDWAHDVILPNSPEGTLQVTNSMFGLSPDAADCPGGFQGYCKATGPNSPAPHYAPLSVGDLYDLSQNNDLTIGQRRLSANLVFNTEVAGGGHFYTEDLYTDRRSDGQYSPPSFKSSSIDDKYPDGARVPAAALGNPYGKSVALRKQFAEYGPSNSEADAPTFRLLAGFRGELFSRVDWDVSYLYGEDSERLSTSKRINFTHALQEIGVLPCDGAAGCVAADFFSPGNLSQAAANYLFYTGQVRAKYSEQSLDATLSGTLAGLPAGSIGVAVGGDFRRLSGHFTPDAATLSGDQQGPDMAPTSGAYDAREAFAELKLPLLARMPAIQELDLLGAARYSKFGSFGDAVTWKAGVDWAITPDLRLRGAHTTGFRAPSITELFLGKAGISGAETDPCDSADGLTSNPTVAANCAAQGVPANYLEPGNNYPTFFAGNPQLQPETSQSWNAGLVLTPRPLPGLSLTLDYYNIFIRNSIGRLDPNLILQQCYESANLSSPDCADIGPRTSAATGAPHVLTSITDTEGNLGAIKTDGLDLVLHEEFGLRWLGLPGHNSLVLDNSSTWTFSYEEQTGASGPFVQFAGTEDFPTSTTNPGLIAHFRNKAVIDLRHDRYDLAWTVQYLGAGNAVAPQGPSPSFPGNHTPGTVYHSLAATYRCEGFAATFGINNVFDKDPPFWNDGTVNTNEFTFDTVGRYFYLNFRLQPKKWPGSSV